MYTTYKLGTFAYSLLLFLFHHYTLYIIPNRTQPQFDPELIRLVEAIEHEPGLKTELYHSFDLLDISKHTLDILDALACINTRCTFSSPTQTPHLFARTLLHKLHCSPKSIEYSEAMAQFNLRSPEGRTLNL